ncbi:MAG: diphthamide synthesis protein [Nanoarchaeota archaeon]
MNRTIKDLREEYDLEFERVITEIKKTRAKIVLLQFPDGLKQYSTVIVDYLSEIFRGRVKFLIWLESCFGACDTPTGIDGIKPKIDLFVQFGHNNLFPSYI